MKFTCKQQVLSKALNIVSKAVSNKTTMPVLKGIFISADEGCITITASDMDLSIQHSIKEDIIVEQPGEAVISAKLFMDIIRKLPNEMISIEDMDGTSIRVKTSGSEFTILAMDADEFPKTSLNDQFINVISFNKETFKDMIKKTSFAASTDEGKGTIIGVLIEFEEGSTNMAALDGFRMAVNREPMVNEFTGKIIIEARIINEINKILSESGNDEEVIIKATNRNAQISLSDTVVNLRLLEGEFIKYRDILPKEFRTVVEIDKTSFINAIERASLLAKDGKNNLIRVYIKNNLLTITSRSDEGNVKEEIIINKYGEDIEIGFNSKYLLDSLKVIDDDIIKLNLNTSVTPALIKPLEGDAYDFLVLPVRIASV